jgi:predicted CxxxxCH...CXXCH cytochrome family protein
MSDCSLCHGAVVGSDDVTLIDPSLHVNGTVDVDGPTSCTACHGGTNAAPPVDTTGGSDTSLASVGAHQSHVLGSARARAVPCSDCHSTPRSVFDSGHLDSALPAEVQFAGAGAAYGGQPVYQGGTCSETSCHGGTFPVGHQSGGSNKAPVWTKVGAGEAACGSCHSLPPPAPHPKASLNPVCSACHKNIEPDNTTFVRPDLHVDGVVTFELP